jgi:2-polyprenyl-6-methoxyphenol hydroxylase-like FAD-dependent oxidoreductase
MNLYSGMGATSSLRGGAALGAALQEHPDDLDASLAAWEAGLRPFITKHQRSARLKQQMFVPSSRRAEALRSVLLGLVRRIRSPRPAMEAGGLQAPALSATSR